MIKIIVEIKASKKAKRFKKRIEPLIGTLVEIEKNYPHVTSMEIIVKA